MDQNSFENILLFGKNIELKEAEIASIIESAGEDYKEEVTVLIGQAQKIALPKAVYAVTGFDAKTDCSVTIRGIEIKSELMAKNFEKINRVFPYVCGCGTELEEWSESFSSDPLAEYWADRIKLAYLGHMIGILFNEIRDKYNLSGHWSTMNPGSIREWPLIGQRELFSILDPGYVKENVGTYLKPSMLMIPSKSVSGIGFENEAQFHNCSRCPIKNCPNRRAEQTIFDDLM